MRLQTRFGRGLCLLLLATAAAACTNSAQTPPAPVAQAPAPPAPAPLPVRLVDQFNTMFGVHPGFRANHAKGSVFEGTFTPAPTAKSLSKAAHLQNAAVPKIGSLDGSIHTSQRLKFQRASADIPGANRHPFSGLEILGNAVNFKNFLSGQPQ